MNQFTDLATASRVSDVAVGQVKNNRSGLYNPSSPARRWLFPYVCVACGPHDCFFLDAGFGTCEFCGLADQHLWTTHGEEPSGPFQNWLNADFKNAMRYGAWRVKYKLVPLR